MKNGAKIAIAITLILVIGLFLKARTSIPGAGSTVHQRPNILLIVTDDQSWEHTSFAGYPYIKTPNFDVIARQGVYFSKAYASAPSCTASRSAILSGQHFWRAGSGSLLWGEYPKHLINFMHILQHQGYVVGGTGKRWGPYSFSKHDRPFTGIRWIDKNKREASEGLSNTDYVENFNEFLTSKEKNKPFMFWLGAIEPHRPYTTGKEAKKKSLARFSQPTADAANQPRIMPTFLPETKDMLHEFSAYLSEIEWFDNDLGKIMALLAQKKLSENTIVIITSDNGMPFPRGKANNYQHGVRVPLVIRWSTHTQPASIINTRVSLIDIAPTLLDAAGIDVPEEMDGISLLPSLLHQNNSTLDARQSVFSGFERHAGHARENNETYPVRAVHTAEYLYIRNFQPDRWPAGDPPYFLDMSSHKARLYFTDQLSSEDKDQYFHLVVAKRPAEELYYLPDDPAQINNVADTSEYETLLEIFRQQLKSEMIRSNDPIITGEEEDFSEYSYGGLANQKQ